MILPKNTAAEDAKEDAGLISSDQASKKTNTELEKAGIRDRLWSRVASAKTASDYKELIDENFDEECLLELLEANAARTTILSSLRISPADYLKLQVILDKRNGTVKTFLADMIEAEYTKL
ncbi:hypothetical protein ACPV5R_18630 [Vibrio astriarenae]